MVLIITIHTIFKQTRSLSAIKGAKRLINTLSATTEQHLHGSRAMLAILLGTTGNTHGLYLQYSWALYVKPDSIAYKT